MSLKDKFNQNQEAPQLEQVAMQQIDPGTGELTQTDLSVAPVTVEPHSFDFDALEAATTGASVAPMYWSPSQKGQKSRGYFQGIGTITKNEPEGVKEIEVARWLNREGLFMNGGAGFVKLFHSVEPGTAIELEYLGKENTMSGHKVNTFDLRLLNL